MELKEKPLRGFANEDVCGSRVDPGVADVLAIHPTNSLRSSARTPSQGPEGLPDAENKLLRSFANGDVCGSWVIVRFACHASPCESVNICLK